MAPNQTTRGALPLRRASFRAKLREVDGFHKAGLEASSASCATIRPIEKTLHAIIDYGIRGLLTRAVTVRTCTVKFDITQLICYVYFMGHYKANARKWNAGQLIDAVKTCKAFSDVLRKLGLVPSGGNYAQLKKYVEEYGLDTSHLLGRRYNQGRKFTRRYKAPLEELLVEGTHLTTSSLRLRLIAAGLLTKHCYKCLLVEWNGLAIPLELEHINGVRTDNRLENLTLLCPNCHAQTDTYRGKNIKIRASVGMVYEDPLKGSAACSVGVRIPPGVPKKNRCYDCTKPISETATRCRRCAQRDKDTKIEWPTTDWLKEQVANGESYCSLSRKLGVTDNAIRKRIKNHGE